MTTGSYHTPGLVDSNYNAYRFSVPFGQRNATCCSHFARTRKLGNGESAHIFELHPSPVKHCVFHFDTIPVPVQDNASFHILPERNSYEDHEDDPSFDVNCCCAIAG